MGTSQDYLSISRRPPDIEDYIEMFRRYRSWVIGPMFACLVLSVIVAFLWPDTYISQAVMRITPQQVSERLLPAVINTQMADRIGQMQQEILSRNSLATIIQKPSLDLYKKQLQRLPMADVVEDMRTKDIKIRMADDPGTKSQGGPGKLYASAFSISFSYPDRYKAQAVVNELVAKFMEQNVTVQANQAKLTDSFLSEELKSAKEKVDALEAAMTKFRMDNQGKLPEQLESNMQALANLQLQSSTVADSLGRDHQDKLLLETRLQTLKNSQNFASSNLEETVAGQSVKNQRLIDLNNKIADGKSALAASRQFYKEDYPEIGQLKARISTLEKERDDLEKQQQQTDSGSGTKRVVNPMVQKSLEDLKNEQLSVQAQLAAKQSDIEARIKRQADLNRQMAGLEARIEGSTGNQQQYAAMLRDFNLAKSDYEEKSRKKDLSETAKNLEDHKAGENLEVLDPASLPEKPAEPQRWQIIGVGTAMGLMFGVVLAGAREVKNTALKNLKDVRAYTNLPVLSSIPLLENALLVRRKRRMAMLAWSSAVMVGFVAMSGAVYYYYFGRS